MIPKGEENKKDVQNLLNDVISENYHVIEKWMFRCRTLNKLKKRNKNVSSQRHIAVMSAKVRTKKGS